MYFKISILSILYLFLSFNLYSADHSILKIQENDFYIGDRSTRNNYCAASMSCSHCADFHNETLGDLKVNIDTGKVKFVFRDFPFNYPALADGMILSCVPEDVRYDYMNALYKLKKNWVMRDHSKTRSEL